MLEQRDLSGLDPKFRIPVQPRYERGVVARGSSNATLSLPFARTPPCSSELLPVTTPFYLIGKFDLPSIFSEATTRTRIKDRAILTGWLVLQNDIRFGGPRLARAPTPVGLRSRDSRLSRGISSSCPIRLAAGCNSCCILDQRIKRHRLAVTFEPVREEENGSWSGEAGGRGGRIRNGGGKIKEQAKGEEKQPSRGLAAAKTSMLHLRWEYSWVTVHL